jgi:hypothetical protein
MPPIVAACMIYFMMLGQARSGDGASCTIDAKGIVTVKGTIRFLFSRVVPIRNKTGLPDYSIVDAAKRNGASLIWRLPAVSVG